MAVNNIGEVDYAQIKVGECTMPLNSIELPNSSQIKQGNRDPYIDAIRGFAILLVVLGHSIQVTQFNFDDNLIFRIIYAFHMPLFIFLSGFVAYRSMNKYSFYRLLQIKSLQLLVPFLSWYFIVGYFLCGQYNSYSIKDYSLQLIKSPDVGLWFFWVLFCCSIIVSAVLKLRKISLPLCILFVGMFLVLALFLGKMKLLFVNWVAWLLPFYVAGMICQSKKENLSRWRWILSLAAFFIFPALVGFWYRTNPPIFLLPIKHYSSAGYLLAFIAYSYVVAFSGIALAFIMVHSMRNFARFQQLAWLGRYTLDIYAIHAVFLSVLGYAACDGYNPYVIAVTFVTTVSCSLFTSFCILRQNKVVRLLLLGQ